MGKKYNGGFTASTGFQRTSNEPLDDSTIVEFKNDLRTVEKPYKLMIVGVLEDLNYYKWNGLEITNLDNWVIIGSGSNSETLTSLSINANILSYLDENGDTTTIDLSLYLDDTNLARLVSGTLNSNTGIATFLRDDNSTFTVDLSSLTSEINNKVDKVTGKGLSTNDFDNYHKGIVQGVVAQTFAGNVIPLDKQRTSYQTDTVKNFTSYVIGSNVVLGSDALIWSKSTTKPTITLHSSVTNVSEIIEKKGSQWFANVDYDLIIGVEDSEVAGKYRVTYYFVER